MKRKIGAGLAITAALLGSSVLPLQGLAASKNFSDIDNSYAKEAILELAEKGILVGFPSGQFNPTGELTRQDFAIVLAKALNLNIDDVPSNPTFSDVSKNSYAYKYVEAAAKANLIKGLGDGSFGGSSVLSRQDMATMFVRALGVDASGYASKLTFSDADSISDYAKDAVGFTLDAGLLKGIGNNTFNPKGMANRQDVAVVASKFLVVKEELKKPEPKPEPKPEQKPEPKPEQPPVVIPSPIPDPIPVQNHAPILENTIENQFGTVGTPINVDLSNVFTDSDGDALTITANIGVVIGNTWSYTPVLEDGGKSIIVTLTADDSKGGVATETFDISYVEHDNPSFSITEMDSFDATITRFTVPAAPTVIRYSKNSLTTPGNEMPYFDNIMEHITITKNSGATIIKVHRSPGGILIIKTDNSNVEIGDTIEINSNQFTDETGGVLSGTLVMTYNGLGWTPSMQ